MVARPSSRLSQCGRARKQNPQPQTALDTRTLHPGSNVLSENVFCNRFRALVRGKLIKPFRIDQLELSTLSADVSTFWFRPGSRERNNEGR